MNRWEMQDNREPRAQPGWWQWQPQRPNFYLFRLIFFAFMLPFLFGWYFTPIGALLNVAVIDYILYRGSLFTGDY